MVTMRSMQLEPTERFARAAARSAGVVSLMVTMVMMIVISLVVLGFAEISRNEQRNTLDEQLSTQAYYAAESGVNDARVAINAQIAAGAAVQDKTSCGNQGSYTLNSTVDAAHNVSYTCVLVNTAVPSLVYDVGYTSTVVPVISGGPAFGSLTLSWKLPSGTAGSAAGCYTDTGSLKNFPVATGSGQWGCDYPVLRVDMLDANGALARADWNANTSTFFFVPFNSNSVADNAGLGAHGTATAARCDATACTARITGVAGTKYYLRITTLYRTNSQLTITNTGGATFTGAEATIDSTGKAQDVLRRILVAIDLTDANARAIPSAGLITEDSVCKRFGVTTGSFNVYDDLSPGGGGNTLCSQQSLGTPTP